MNAALLNWTDGAAQGLVEHGCENGLDAWRRLYNRYIPGAEDLQGVLMEELVNIQEIDSSFTEIERITEWYIKADSNHLRRHHNKFHALDLFPTCLSLCPRYNIPSSGPQEETPVQP